jgi:hypothetical protein
LILGNSSVHADSGRYMGKRKYSYFVFPSDRLSILKYRRRKASKKGLQFYLPEQIEKV